MACEFKLFCRASIMSIFILMLGVVVASEPQVPCYFIFGDSLVDSGNNNVLNTSAKANYLPYGIDFPQGPTGRFTNGRNLADFIAQHLGFTNFIPPYATARDEEISRGVNYGSGGAGILAETGSQLGERLSLDMQLRNHGTTLLRLAQLQGNITFTREYRSKCIYTVGMGSNDYINNYFMPNFYTTSRQYTPEQYAEVLAQKFSQQLRTLYTLGARKVAVFGVGRIGCTPAEIAKFGTNGSPCVGKINNATQLFNDKLKLLVDNLNTNLPNAMFTFINITNISSADPSAAGITVLNTPCCIVRGDKQCAPNNIPCSIRGRNAFYDGFHPTEAVNFLVASRSYNAVSPLDASPVDISHLAQLQ